ncbi:MAG: MFS transporter [Bacilli bacterium]|jgi:MFS family permease|nr:SLC45 family MFS transporter [Erysipelotrichia bacterium]
MKLNVKRTFLVGFAFLLISMFWQVYDSAMSIILVTHYGLNQFWSGVVLALDNILALFLLPLFGRLSDRTNTKMGKRKPYILIGTIVAALVFIVLGFIDKYQIASIHGMNVGPVLFDEAAQTYYFTVDGTRQLFEYDGVFRIGYPIREVVSQARGAYIFETVTKPNWYYLATFIAILFIVLLAMCSFRTPAVSLMPDVTLKPLRSKANAIINAMGTIGGAISLGLITFIGTMDPTRNYSTFTYLPLFIVIALVMLLMLTVFMVFVKETAWSEEMRRESIELGIETKESEDVEAGTKGEKMTPEVRKSFILILSSVVLWFFAYNAATSKIAVYSTEVLGIVQYSIPMMVAFISALIAFYPVGIISTKIGRKTTIMGGLVIFVTGFLCGFLAGVIPGAGWLVYVSMAVVGVGWASINVNSYPMVVEMSHGANIGVYTGYYYTASMAAQIFTPMLSGLFMDWFSMRWALFPYSIVFGLAALVTMFFVKHGEPKKIDVATEEVLVEEVPAE